MRERDRPDDWDGMVYFRDKVFGRLVSIFSVFLAALLLVGAITSLYVVSNATSRIVLVAVFTTVFAASVGLLTNSRKVDIYAATAA
jgi:ABC-type transport system involved in cytochrome c biogenesis permease subunit